MSKVFQLPYEKVERQKLVKLEIESDPSYGCVPEQRPTEEIIKYGMVNIDKPSGPSSHLVSDHVKQILDLKKTGHSGTLDPAVTGLLPVALENATRIVQVLLSAGKEYIAVMHLHDDAQEKEIRKTCKDFLGKIKQLPPVRSAVKRQVRTRSVYYLDILEIDGRDVLFRVGTEAGTYIRKLIHDIGKGIGCGAHMTGLRRTRVGPFREDTLVTLHDLADAYYYYKEEGNDALLRKAIQPVEKAVEHLPKVWVADSAVDPLCHGAMLYKPGVAALDSQIMPTDRVAMMTLKDELIGFGVARCTTGEMLSDSGVAVRTEKIFMQRGTYPKQER